MPELTPERDCFGGEYCQAAELRAEVERLQDFGYGYAKKYDAANADAEMLAGALQSLDELIRYLADRHPAGFREMPKRLYDALGEARAAFNQHEDRVGGGRESHIETESP